MVKKLLLINTALCLLLLAASCAFEGPGQEVGYASFDAEVLYYSDSAEVYVRSLGNESNSCMTADKNAYVGTRGAKSKYLNKGDHIRVTYNCMEDSDPPRISAVTIYILD